MTAMAAQHQLEMAMARGNWRSACRAVVDTAATQQRRSCLTLTRRVSTSWQLRQPPLQVRAIAHANVQTG